MTRMIRLLPRCAAAVLGICTLFLPITAQAQNKQAPGAALNNPIVPNPIEQEFQNLIAQDGRGFTASHQLLNSSFAAHLHGRAQPLSLAELDQLGASYDPQSDTALTAGMLYYHLARPVALLRELDRGGDEILARVIELRIRWLAGDRAAARRQLEDLIVQFAAIGGRDDAMVSLLADAAILAWRDGDVAAAQGFLIRAQACDTPRCPQDFVFDWLGPNRKSVKLPDEAYDADKMRDMALAGVADLVASPEQMISDIRLEWAFVTGDWGRDLSWAAGAAEADPAGPTDLLPQEQARIRHIADRLQLATSMSPYLLRSASVASEWSDLQTPDGVLSAEKLQAGDIAYIGEARWDDFILANWPILHRLYQVSDRPADVLTAQVIEARLVLSEGDFPRATRLLSQILTDAKAQGFSNAQLHSVWMDLWAAAVLSDEAQIAAQAKAATAQCRQSNCAQDVVARVAGRYMTLPKARFPTSRASIFQAEADRFIRATFPGDFLKLADLYGFSGSAAGNRPMDAARDERIGFEFAEQAAQITDADLIQRGARAMETLIVAGQFRQATQIGDRVAQRVERAGNGALLSADFSQKRARAAFRLGDARAQAFYKDAVAKNRALRGAARRPALAYELALDLLDTGFDDVLLELIEGWDARDDMRARVLFRQGKPAEAAAVLRSFRRRMEIGQAQSRDILDGLFAARARAHLRSPNLDAYVAALLVQRRVQTLGGYLFDHPAVYAQSAHLRAMALQEAHYQAAAGDHQEAERLQALGQTAVWPGGWRGLDAPLSADHLARFEQEASGFASSMSLIAPMLDLRDSGNYQGAAAWMRDMGWVAQGAHLRGSYADAQTLWQMAFTFARAGETTIAFDLMDRAAQIAARLSFEGAGDGMLQVLERDRWRYLLFVDIAWGAVTGTVPEQMLVVSRY